ncbi:protein-disulfide reductase DsbD family protein [Algoriphagus machipongonensis]|uniref:Thiol:disulfide interchange protein DsbD n=1 Tax=Algoriphagus machipongonensis TaxID=388413 RepID=A3HUL2_9BACT|nr:cytochrome c biogenesis protein CcdA [Algoriphagus machipongonensis]EAZ81834.1 putative thiol:disulfide interchange protein DsbD [Algoriphagus machipongonensis]
MKFPRFLLAFAAFFILLINFGELKGQIVTPPEWEITLSPEKPALGEEATLVLEAKIPIGWYVYSNDFDPDLGPNLTELNLEESEDYTVSGNLIAIDPKEKYDETWEGDVTYFMGKGRFEQGVILNTPTGTIQGNLEYQMCSDVTGLCINYDLDILVNFNTETGENSSSTSEESSENNTESDSPFGMVDSEDNSSDTQVLNNTNFTADNEIVDTSLIGFMALAFLAGLAALLTPCVFPMIPMTVTFFTGRSKSKAKGIQQAIIYGLSIIGIYTIAGTAVAAIQGPEFANWLATHWLPNLFFFGVFIFFALAFLGLFEINLPSGLVNKVDAKAEKGGFAGVFFMAFTLVLVSFSCTGPIVGSILISSAGGELIKPVLGMFAFSMAFAIPFTLFAIFPEWMKSLPKSGGWLNSVKVVLGFLELALAFKFLSMADLVYHWGILDRDVFLVIWIVIFAALGFYLLGKIKLPHDSQTESIGVPRLLLALITFMFVIYMIPGLFGAPLKLLSGYLPPLTTQNFSLTSSKTDSAEESSSENIKYDDILDIPLGINGYFDYDQALAAAKKEGKPLMIDFTGHGCVNCRKMEENVWVEPAVLSRLKNDFVMVALYIDERLELPESEWYTSEYDGKVKKTLGKQNADFQITKFNNNAQPYYVILDHDENLLAKPHSYDTNIQNFVDFLDGAKEEFEKRK